MLRVAGQTPWVTGGCKGLKNAKLFFNNFFFQTLFSRATSGPSASKIIKMKILLLKL